MRFKRVMQNGAGQILAIILGLTAGSALVSPSPLRCHLEQGPAAAALLAVWAQALTGRNGLLTAHSTRQIAVVVDHRPNG